MPGKDAPTQKNESHQPESEKKNEITSPVVAVVPVSAPTIPPMIRFPHRLLIRMTSDERKALGRKAHGAEMSISRFLIHTALRGKAPPSQAERAELESLMFLVKRSANVLTRLLANTRAMRLVGADKEIEEQLKQASELLLRLLTELKRRL